jgi:hypothetical protein
VRRKFLCTTNLRNYLQLFNHLMSGATSGAHALPDSLAWSTRSRPSSE